MLDFARIVVVPILVVALVVFLRYERRSPESVEKLDLDFGTDLLASALMLVALFCIDLWVLAGPVETDASRLAYAVGATSDDPKAEFALRRIEPDIAGTTQHCEALLAEHNIELTDRTRPISDLAEFSDEPEIAAALIMCEDLIVAARKLERSRSTLEHALMFLVGLVGLSWAAGSGVRKVDVAAPPSWIGAKVWRWMAKKVVWFSNLVGLLALIGVGLVVKS